jgi:membrane protein DedA with SNARE-associated domain
MSAVTPRQFAIFAYSGACIWVSCFLALGYFLGERWQTVEGEFRHYALIASSAGAAALVAYLVWRKWFRR